jgi:RNA polymerase sigma-70 factor (ECF subfamily)
MSEDPFEILLEQLCRGDAGAAEQVFRRYESALRQVVRRHLPSRLRAQFDSADVVQSVWAHLLPGFRGAGWRFANAAQLRAFLVTVTRNRLHDRYRRSRRALEREESLAQASPERLPDAQPGPSEWAAADELWDRMLGLCPPEHHDVLRLRRQGLLLREIADRTGLHEGSVRRILRRLARDLACHGPPPADLAP